MKPLALVAAILAGVTAAVPRFLFPDCGHQPGANPKYVTQMHCYQAGHWVEVAMAVAIVAWLLVAFRRGVRWPLVVLAGVAASGSLGAVLVWPGVCDGTTMACVVGTRPAVLALGALQLVVAAVALLVLGLGRRRPR